MSFNSWKLQFIGVNKLQNLQIKNKKIDKSNVDINAQSYFNKTEIFTIHIEHLKK